MWPAAGVGFAWALTSMLSARGQRELAFVLTALVPLTYVLNIASGAPPAMAIAFCVSNIAQAAASAWVYRGLGSPARRPSPVLDSRNQLLRLCLASAVGGVGSSLGGPLFGVVFGGGGVDLLWQSAIRTGISDVAIGALLLRLAFPTPPLRQRPLHQGLLGVTSVVAYWLAMHAFPHPPLAFLVTAATIWAATTLTLDGVVVFTLVTGLVTVVATLAHDGPFVLAGPVVGVFLAQGYVMMMTFTGLVLGLVRESARASSSR